MNRRKIASIMFVACCWIDSGTAMAGGAPASPPESEWRVIGLTPDNQHFSPLKQISDKNVAQLSLAWWADIPTRDGLVGEPLIADGVVYQSGVPSMIWANDARTGKLIWAFNSGVHYSGQFVPNWGARINRGLALWKDKVFVGTGDCRLVAVSRSTGKKAWEADVCQGNSYLTITGAPRVGGGKIFMGSSNADSGNARGFVDAYDADTGKRLWRFYTIPADPAKGFENKAMERAAKTFGKGALQNPAMGNAGVYEGITYDEKLNLLYFGTASLHPEAPVERGSDRGDELYSACLVAVNADTGAYVWHFKETPNNAWNFDSNSPITIANLKINGKMRRVLLHAPKNGFFYVFDAATGKFISADKYGPRITWASSVNQKTGRPNELPASRYYETKSGVALHYPGQIGARAVLPAAFSPVTGLTYVSTMDIAGRTTFSRRVPGAEGNGPESGAVTLDVGSPDILAAARTQLVAWDPVQRRVRWALEEPLPYFGATLATAGNVVFAGRGSLLRAFDAGTGKMLWSRQIPGGTVAAPITVQIDGEQLILFAVGNNGASAETTSESDPYITDGAIRNAPSRLLAFKLGGNATLPPTNLADIYPRPPLPRFPRDLAEKGKAALAQNGCDYCHGGIHLNAVGSVPNLKKATAATHERFARIVIGGERKPLGMPDFSYLDEATVKLIQAYVINQAWDAYDAQEKKAR